MSEVKRYTKRPVTIEAVQLTQYGDFVRATAWINDNGGSAVFSPRIKDSDQDYLIVQTIEGNMEARKGWWIIKGVKGEFYPCEPEIFTLSYEEAEPASEYVPETSGLYERSKNDSTTRPDLSGGVALSATA